MGKYHEYSLCSRLNAPDSSSWAIVFVDGRLEKDIGVYIIEI